MRQMVARLVQKPLVHNVLLMASGTAAAQAIALVLTPVITRLYGPDAYGLMGVFAAITQTMAPIAALTYPIAIVLPQRDRDAKKIMRLSLYAACGLALVVAVLLWLFQESVVEVFQLDMIAPFLFLLPFVIVLAASLQVVRQWLVRTKQFAVTAKAVFWHAVFVQGGKAGFGVIYPTAGVLIVFTALGYGVKALFMWLLRQKSADSASETGEHVSLSYRKLAGQYRDFPLFRAPQVLINGLSQNIPVFLLTSLFNPAAAGFYNISRTVLSLPTQLIGKSVGDVLYPRMTEAVNNQENLPRLIGRATLTLAAIGIVPFGVIMVWGPSLFSFVFGADWVTAGHYARWMALWTFALFLNQPSLQALPVIAAQAFHLGYTIVTLIIRTGALWAGYSLFHDDVAAVACFSLAAALLSLGLIMITLTMANNPDRQGRRAGGQAER